MGRLPRMTKDEVVEAIQKLYADGGRLNSSYIQKNNGRLFRGALKNFGSWRSAIESSGVDYENIAIQTHTEWDRERVLREIRELYKEDRDLSYTTIKKDKQMLYNCARRYFGEWSKALEYCGINSKDYYKKKPKWEEFELKEEISRVYNSTGRLDEKYFRENHHNLISACGARFGGWFNTLRQFGFPTDGVEVHWTKDLVLERIKRQEGCLAYSEVPTSLYLAARRLFGSWEEALSVCGVDVAEHRKYEQWTKDIVVERLRQLVSDGVNPTYSSIYVVDSALASAYVRFFNSWEELLRETGVQINNYGGNNKKIIGMEFERLVRDVLERLGIEYAYQQVQSNRLRPDFVLKDGTWADAKLSSWTAFVDGTLDKYLPHTSHLTIIYLRGDVFETKKDVTLLPIDEFLPKLDKERDSDLFDRLRLLKERVEDFEKSEREEVSLVG